MKVISSLVFACAFFLATSSFAGIINNFPNAGPVFFFDSKNWGAWLMTEPITASQTGDLIATVVVEAGGPVRVNVVLKNQSQTAVICLTDAQHQMAGISPVTLSIACPQVPAGTYYLQVGAALLGTNVTGSAQVKNAYVVRVP